MRLVNYVAKFRHILEEASMSTSEPRPVANYDPFPPGQNERKMTIEMEVEDMGNMLRRAFTKGHGSFTIYCDEPPAIGGNSTAPAPLHYFAASILF